MKPYQDLCPIDTPAKTRAIYNIGDIFENKAKCLECGSVIISKNRHDYVICNCGNLSVDGGSWYLKRGFKKEDSYEEQSIMYNDVKGK